MTRSTIATLPSSLSMLRLPCSLSIECGQCGVAPLDARVDHILECRAGDIFELGQALVDVGRGGGEAVGQIVGGERLGNLVELAGEAPRLGSIAGGSAYRLVVETGLRCRPLGEQCILDVLAAARARMARSSAAVPFVHAAKQTFTADAAPAPPSTTRVSSDVSFHNAATSCARSPDR